MAPSRDDVRRLLGVHQPADETERQHLESMRALLDANGDPFRRDRFEPGHFTASAFVLSPARDSLLLVYHGKLHRWLQPGGHIDPDDVSIEHAARRELSEETGLTGLSADGGLFDLDVHAIPPRKTEPGHRHFDLRVLFVAGSEEPARAGSDARDARWVALREVHELETDASVMRAVGKLLDASA